jgi:hypothetical protein
MFMQHSLTKFIHFAEGDYFQFVTPTPRSSEREAADAAKQVDKAHLFISPFLRARSRLSFARDSPKFGSFPHAH